jgi:hypothetical protein
VFSSIGRLATHSIECVLYYWVERDLLYLCDREVGAEQHSALTKRFVII